MARKRRHSSEEVSAKLQQADALIAQGIRQKDVATALGISVMTFHRWRKIQAGHDEPKSIALQPPRQLESVSDRNLREKIAELQLENSRLRRLVTDFLLEKVKLQEAAVSPNAAGELTRRPAH
jgi:putative transposase